MPLPVACYSSSHQRPQDRYAAWREGSLLSFGRLYDTAPLVPFGVETSVAQLGAIGFAHARMTSQNWARTRDHIRADGADPLMVAIRFEGAGRGDAAGLNFEAPAGCVGLTDFAQPQAYYSDTASSVVLAIPRVLAERSLPPVRSLHGLVIQPQAATLLRSYAATLVEALHAGQPAHNGERLGRVALDLLEIGIAQSTANASLRPAAAATGARLAAEAAIERKLGSATLTVDNLCRWIGVSRSTLYRLFDVDGGIQAYIRNRRLARIEEELRRGGREPLAAMAERWGFADGSHLSRMFRARYGQSPTDFRAAHTASVREGTAERFMSTAASQWTNRATTSR